MRSLRVGILESTDPEKGIRKCAQTLAWAAQDHEISMFPVGGFDALYRNPPADFIAWAGAQDVVVFIEQLLPAAMEVVLNRGSRVIFIPNLDWAVLLGSNDPAQWLDCLRALPIEVWSRTPSTQRVLAQAGVLSRLVGWSLSDAVISSRNGRSGDPVFLMNAGRGGYRKRRNVDVALRAFALLRRRGVRARFVLKTLRPLDKMASIPVDPAVTLVEGWKDRVEIEQLQAEADVVLHPSRWEGLGLPILEALHAGLPVIATDGWPMNEIVTHERTGLLVPSRRAGDFRLAAHWECGHEALAESMKRLAEDHELRRRLTCPCPEEWANRQRGFIATVERALIDPYITNCSAA
jgi:glycosyltransferase involved in cell wall biosynthesis